MTNYERIKKAKTYIKNCNRVGWPDTEEGISKLCEEMGEMEQKIFRIGRFVRNWRGWVFQMPSTNLILDAVENNRELRKDILFVTDEEG